MCELDYYQRDADDRGPRCFVPHQSASNAILSERMSQIGAEDDRSRSIMEDSNRIAFPWEDYKEEVEEKNGEIQYGRN